MAFGLGVAKGMLTTISHLVKPPVTIQYPEERLDMPIWTRGRPRLIYEMDTGELRCTACGACALACPVDVIKIEQHPSPIKGKILDRFDIDMAGCIECALCVEACPFRAITMEGTRLDTQRALDAARHVNVEAIENLAFD